MKNIMIANLGFVALLLNSIPAIAESPISKKQTKDIEKVVENFLLENPEVMEKAFQNLQDKRQRQKTAENKLTVLKHAKALFNNATDPFIGNPEGQKKLVVFMDPFCGHCRKFHKTLNSALQDKAFKDLKIIFKDLPIFGEISKLAVQANFAAKNQGKYAEFQNAIFEASSDLTKEDIENIAQKIGLDINQFKADLSSSIIASKITETEELASKLNIEATPTIIYDNLIIPGGPDLETLKKLISIDTKNKI